MHAASYRYFMNDPAMVVADISLLYFIVSIVIVVITERYIIALETFGVKRKTLFC